MATPNTSLITLNGHSYDLATLTPQQAAELYKNLPPQYQEIANRMAGLVKKMNQIESFNLPIGVTIDEAINNLNRELNANSGEISEKAAPYLKQMYDSSLGQLVRDSSLFHAAKSAGEVAGTASQLASGFGKAVGAPGALLNGLVQVKQEADVVNRAAWHPVTDAQARDVGAAYAAMMMQSHQTSAVDAAPGFFDKAFAWAQSMFGKLWHVLPEGLSAFIAGIGKWIGSGFADWGASQKAALEETRAARLQAPPSWQQILRDSQQSRENTAAQGNAAEQFLKLEQIAGVSTQPFARLFANGGIYLDRAGTLNAVSFALDGPHTEAVKDSTGKPLTFLNRSGKILNDAAKDHVPNSLAESLGAAAATVTPLPAINGLFALGKNLVSDSAAALDPHQGESNRAVTSTATPLDSAKEAVSNFTTSIRSQVAAVVGNPTPPTTPAQATAAPATAR